MKRTLIATVLLTGLLAVQAQERLPRAEALRYAFLACSDLKEMLNTPIPTDPDVKRPVVMHDGDYGVMVLWATQAALAAKKRDNFNNDQSPHQAPVLRSAYP